MKRTFGYHSLRASEFHRDVLGVLQLAKVLLLEHSINLVAFCPISGFDFKARGVSKPSHASKLRGTNSQ